MPASRPAPPGPPSPALPGTRPGSRRRRRGYRRRQLRRRVGLAATALLLLLLPGQPVAAVGTTRPDATALAHPAPAALAQPAPAPLAFVAPVVARVTDGWRPPSTTYGPGNRGWQYGTSDGDEVSAAGAGTVTFAGHVGGVQAVTVTHRGGLRTTYTRLSTVSVRVHDRVGAGQPIGTAMIEFHFGVRLGERYVDPAVLFEPGALRYGAYLRPL